MKRTTFKTPTLTTRNLLAAAALCGTLALPTTLSTAWAADKNADEPQAGVKQSQSQWRDQAVEDSAIQVSILSEYVTESVPWYHDVDVAVDNGKVTLKGQVASLRQKELAQRFASTVRGVESIQNNLKVKRRDNISSSELSDRVNRALLINTATEAFEIDVHANDNGKVTLKGEVESYAERWLARDVAAGVLGVVDVANQIDVNYKTDRLASEMRQDIVEKLRMDALIDAGEIDVKVDDHTAKLSGQVRSLAERDRAQAAAYVAGIYDVETNGLTVNPSQTPFSEVMSLDDGDIRDAVQTSLMLDPQVDHSEVVTSVYEGRATLVGSVPTLSAKRSAEQSARETTGVRRVDNYLRVTPDSQPDDSQITRQIKQTLVNNSTVESFEINTSVKDGSVTLTGEVDSYFEKWEAANAISSINGVRSLKNRINVDDTSTWLYYDPYVYPGLMPGEMDRSSDTTTTSSDSEIREDIQSELFWSPFVDSDDVNVKVDAGVATLTGTVEDYSELRDATTNAFEGGATAVDNDLRVEDQ